MSSYDYPRYPILLVDESQQFLANTSLALQVQRALIISSNVKIAAKLCPSYRKTTSRW